MPLIQATYRPKGIFRNADISTIYASTIRKVEIPPFDEERMELEDGDFLDIAWSNTNKPSEKLIILLHGLAGNANRPYMKGMARIFNENGWNAVAVNLRGCSMEMNRKYQSYHAGASGDLDEIVQFVLQKNDFKQIALCGFSLGGNIVLKYLGENRKRHDAIIGGAAVSVPCDLSGSLGAINRTRNFIYSKRFERNLKANLLARAAKFPEKVSAEKIKKCSSLREIDDLYTSKAHGFEDADDYYAQSSALQFLSTIEKPSLVLNAQNDSFLSASCYPYEIARESEKLFLETPVYGGHVGFVTSAEHYYHEKRVFEFISSI